MYSENKTPRCYSRSFDFYGALTYDNNNLKVMHPPVREQGVCDVKVYAIENLPNQRSKYLVNIIIKVLACVNYIF